MEAVKKLKVKHEKVYGFLRCSGESVPKIKANAALLGFPTMGAFLDAFANVRASKLREIFE